MKKVLFLFMALSITMWTQAQITHPVKWWYAAKKINTNQAIVFFKATIQNDWHIYSLEGKHGGPTKTAFKFTSSKDVSVVGKPTEPTPLTRYEMAIKMNVSFFEKEVVFQQKIKLNTADATVIKGKIEYMACSNTHCNPPEDLDFTIPLSK